MGNPVDSSLPQNPDFQEAWERVQRFFKMAPELEWAARYLYSSGRIDGMAWLNQKNLDRQLQTAITRKNLKDTLRGME